MQEQIRDIPVTILTGFLGSGKTTLLNHLLAGDHGLRVAVLVNEFGEISIDHKLIASSNENIIELANGCVCCNTRGDFIRALDYVVKEIGNINYIILETSGLADPLPVASVIRDKDLGETLRLDATITVVDALNFDTNLEYADAAFSQMANGDLILINKVDLVAEEVPDLIRKGIRHINSTAPMINCVRGVVDPALLLDVNLSALDEKTVNTPQHEHFHGSTAVDTISFVYERAFEAARFDKFLQQLPAGAWRGKGILNIAGNPRRHVFQLVGSRCSVSEDRSWKQSDDRRSELVFIGRDLDKVVFSEKLSACLVE